MSWQGDFKFKSVISVEYTSKFEVGCTAFSIMAKEHAAYTFVFFCLYFS